MKNAKSSLSHYITFRKGLQLSLNAAKMLITTEKQYLLLKLKENAIKKETLELFIVMKLKPAFSASIMPRKTVFKKTFCQQIHK